MSGDEKFISRWARVKQARAQGLPVQEPAQPVAVAATPEAALEPAADVPTIEPAREPVPKLPPVESLTPESDFKPFMQAAVSAAVRNAAVKKLFADPHFNVMDRLDVYIDDYSIPDPLPPGMLEQLEHVKSTLFPQPWLDAEDVAAQKAKDEAQARAMEQGSDAQRVAEDGQAEQGSEAPAQVIAHENIEQAAEQGEIAAEAATLTRNQGTDTQYPWVSSAKNGSKPA